MMNHRIRICEWSIGWWIYIGDWIYSLAMLFNIDLEAVRIADPVFKTNLVTIWFYFKQTTKKCLKIQWLIFTVMNLHRTKKRFPLHMQETLSANPRWLRCTYSKLRYVFEVPAFPARTLLKFSLQKLYMKFIYEIAFNS